MVQIYFRGGEDIDFAVIGPNHGLQGTGGRFRAGFARYAMELAINAVANADFWLAPNKFSVSSFWFTARINVSGGTNPGLNGNYLWYLTDSGGVIRIRIRLVSQNNAFSSVIWAVDKVNSVGTATQLGSNFTLSNIGTSVLCKLDIQCVYSTTGTFNIYMAASDGSASTLAFTYTGDVTTDSQTLVTGFALGQPGSGGGNYCDWSEVIVSDTDTRTMGLVTLAPVANGNTHTFDTGSPAAANVNETTLNLTTFDGSSVAGQIDQYTIGTLPTGTWQILDFAVSAQLIVGATGPLHMDLGVRSGSTPADYWSSDIAVATNWTTYVYDWPNDPSTSALWTALPVNIGLRSVV